MTPGRIKSDTLTAIVKVEGVGGTLAPSIGTGFVISNGAKHFLVTNKHIIGDWNAADKNISNYYPYLNVYFYLQNEESGKMYKAFPVNIIDSHGKLLPNIKTHPTPIIDVVVIEFEVTSLYNAYVSSFDVSYLLPFNKILGTYTGIGDQVFAVGYPFGITSIYNNYPISKSAYLATLPGSEVKIEFNSKSRAGAILRSTLEGKLLVIDGKIVGGNSGGPLVIPAEIKLRLNPETGGFQHTKSESENLILGIVSTGLGDSGINLAFSSDYIKELIE